MTKQEFAEKWGYKAGIGFGMAQFDRKESLLKDLEEVIKEEIKHSQLNNDAKVCTKYNNTEDCPFKYAMVEGCSDCENFKNKKL